LFWLVIVLGILKYKNKKNIFIWKILIWIFILALFPWETPELRFSTTIWIWLHLADINPNVIKMLAIVKFIEIESWGVQKQILKYKTFGGGGGGVLVVSNVKYDVLVMGKNWNQILVLLWIFYGGVKAKRYLGIFRFYQMW